MDGKHTLDAPDNDELKTIEQVSDRSELSTIYPQAHDQWSGELVSNIERERRQDEKLDTMSFGIRKHFMMIGLLIPLPLIFAAVFAVIGLQYLTEDNVSMFVIPGILLFLFWVGMTFAIYKKLGKLFYLNALSLAPFAFILLATLGVSAPIIFALTGGLHGDSPIIAVAIISIIEIVWSIILTFFLLRIWSTPRLTANLKVGIVSLIIVLLLATMVYLAFF